MFSNTSGLMGAVKGTDYSLFPFPFSFSFSFIDITLSTIIFLYILISLYFFKKSNIREFISNITSKLFDMILKALGISNKIGEKGLGQLSFVIWISGIIATIVYFIILAGFGLPITTILGIIIIIFSVSIFIFNSPKISFISSFPKKHFDLETEKFLKELSSEMGIENVEIRIDKEEGFRSYSYECEYAGKNVKYVVFGSDLVDFLRDNNNKFKTGILAFIFIHELSHILSGDNESKNSIVRLLFPFQYINRWFNIFKSSIKGNNYNYVNVDGRMYLGYTMLTFIITIYQAPFHIIYTSIVSPFYLVSRKMELRADKKAYSFLKSSKALNSLNINTDESIKSYFKFLLEEKLSLLSPSMFEATMGNHPNPVERGNNLGIDIFSN